MIKHYGAGIGNSATQQPKKRRYTGYDTYNELTGKMEPIYREHCHHSVDAYQKCKRCNPHYPEPKEWEKREPIGDYHIEVGQDRYGVCLHHKDGSTWSDPARAMSQLMTELAQTRIQTKKEIIEDILKYGQVALEPKEDYQDYYIVKINKSLLISMKE